MKQNPQKFFWAIGLSFGLALITNCQKKEETQTEEPNKVAANISSAAAAVITCSGSAVNHIITFAEAKRMIDAYQNAVKNRAVASIYDAGGWVKSETYAAEYVRMLLAQPNCCSFRVYNGIGSDNMQHCILVGVDKLGRDILFTTANPLASANSPNIASGTAGDPPPPPMILNAALPCPSVCPGTYLTGP
jgi:hypothetical protein